MIKFIEKLFEGICYRFESADSGSFFPMNESYAQTKQVELLNR